MVKIDREPVSKLNKNETEQMSKPIIRTKLVSEYDYIENHRSTKMIEKKKKNIEW
jgi:hypothetical protein